MENKITENKVTGNKIILIGGPTASGKSQLAMDVAKAIGGAIVNADSMQVYRDLRTLTARPSKSDEAMVPHRLYGVLDGSIRCSAAMWRDMAIEAIEDIRTKGLVPVVTGGTGLYFRTLMQGLAPVPEIPQEIRRAIAQKMREQGPEALHAWLARLDPVMAQRLHPGDRQRVIRALEVIEATGRSLAIWQQINPQGGLADRMAPEQILKFVVTPPRDVLYARCDTRLRRMVEEGDALEEVRTLVAAGYASDMPVMKALGVHQLGNYLEGGLTQEDAIISAQTATRQYAKRQLTWFRNQCSDWNHINTQYSESFYRKIFPVINNFMLTM